MNIALYVFYKSVFKFKNNIVYFRECRCEMLFHGTWFIMMLNTLFKIISWFLHLEFLCLLQIYSLFSEEVVRLKGLLNVACSFIHVDLYRAV